MPRPNLLYIQSDQHSAAVLGCHGDHVVETPNLDRLAANGVSMTSAYCASPICVPSRSSFLTGRYPHENRVWTNSHVLDSGIPTLAHAMGAAGYRPVQIGRMHFVGPDQYHGYADRYVGDHSPNYLGGSPVDHGMLEGTAGPNRVSLRLSGFGQSAYEVHDEYVAASAVDFLNRYGIGVRSGQEIEPFNLSVGLMLPHQPFVARKGDYDRFLGRVPAPRNAAPPLDQTHPYLRWWRKHSGLVDVSEEEIVRTRTAYWALVSRLDQLIGQILTALEDNGLLENTLIVYSTDHGEQVGERGLWWKQTFYEDAARVPVILSWPGHISKGEKCQRVVSHLDLNATILDALGAPALPQSRGRSFLPILEGDASAAWDDIAFSEYCTEPGDPAHSEGEWTTQQRMVRREEWKLIYYHEMQPQLFNLKEDPEEQIDRAHDPSCRAVREDLTKEVLEGWDPARVKSEIGRLSGDVEILKRWAQNVSPREDIRWNLRPEMDYVTGG